MRAAQQTPPQPQQRGGSPRQDDPLQIHLHPDGRVVVRHTSADPAHVETTETTRQWIRRAVRISQPITISGPLADQRVAATLTQLRAASGSTPVEVTEQTLEPLEKGWTGLMWAARHGRSEVVADLIDRGYDPAERPRTLGGLLPGPSAYDLAMVHGHVGVMQVLVAAGVPNPVRNRPPGAPEAIVMRRRMGSWPFAIALAVIALGVVIGLVTWSWTPLLALGLIGLMVALMAVVIGALARTDAVAVDGSRVWTWRNFRWKGPVDLGEVLAVALAKSTNRRTPTLLRLATAEVGAPMGPLTSSGFDAEQVERLTERGARVFTVYLGRFFRPGLERYVGAQLDRERTSVSESARPLLFPTG